MSVYGFVFFFYLETLVPNLEEAVPGPCRHCHAVVGHAQAAHPVVVTRQDTCREATGWETVWWRLPYVQGALWNLQTRTCDTYHRWTAPPCASTARVAPNRRRRSQSVRATSIQRRLKLLIVKISPGFMSSVWYLDTAAQMRACSNPYSSIQSIPVKYSCLGGGLVGLLHRVCRWLPLSWIHTAGFFFLNATMHRPPVAPHTVTLLLALNPEPHRQVSFPLQPLDEEVTATSNSPSLW